MPKPGYRQTANHRKKHSVSIVGEKNPSYGKRGEKSPIYGKKRPDISGSQNPNWKGGITSQGGGYFKKSSPDHPRADSNGYVLLHRFVLEKKLGRFLRTKEIVHHIDGNPGNNSAENLMVFPNFIEHMKFHKANIGEK